MKTRDFGSLAIEKNSPQQFRRERWVPSPIQHHLIFLVGLITRMGKALREFAVICEKKQTFSLRVQTPDVIFSGRNKSGGLMQHDGKRWSDAN